MKLKKIAVGAALAMALAGCETTGGGYGGGGYGGGYGGGGYGGGTQLSQCTRNALIGAGIGAAVGAVTAPDGNRTENAAIGAALGGGGTFLACRYLSNDNRTQARVEQAYQTALQTGRPYETTWTTTTGGARGVQVGAPQPVPGQPSCRFINAQLVTTGNPPVQPLPQERYCYTGQGWIPG